VRIPEDEDEANWVRKFGNGPKKIYKINRSLRIFKDLIMAGNFLSEP
jgi:hypothetical protein